MEGMEGFNRPDKSELRRLEAEVTLAESAIVQVLSGKPAGMFVAPRELVADVGDHLRRAGTPCSEAAISTALWTLIQRKQLHFQDVRQALFGQ